MIKRSYLLDIVSDEAKMLKIVKGLPVDKPVFNKNLSHLRAQYQGWIYGQGVTKHEVSRALARYVGILSVEEDVK